MAGSRPPTTNDQPPTVVVFGGANLDIIARPDRSIQPGVSNPGTVHTGAGGAGRNVAVNLAALGAAATLVSAVGNDAAGDYLLAETARAGVDVSRVVRVADRSNYYVALAGAGPEVLVVSDMAAAESLSPAQVHATAELAQRAHMVVIDANLHPQAIAAAAAAAGPAPLCLLPTSPAKAPRLADVVDHASLIVASVPELEALGAPPIASARDALAAAASLRDRTGALVIVSMGARGIGLAGAEELWLDALPVAVVDVTGAGDAVAAAAVWGVVTGLSEREMVGLARAAGAMTVTVQGATHPALSAAALRAYA
ncbi:MAG TPA: PfkB family carbohydrate kinase [bacterium]|jgi:pseudouridine kinase